jgi:hypothetical protein
VRKADPLATIAPVPNPMTISTTDSFARLSNRRGRR